MQNELVQYIRNFPEDEQKILSQIRDIIRTKAPRAIETMNYGMPAYKFKGKPLKFMVKKVIKELIEY